VATRPDGANHSPPSSPEYIFLGRLVATLPEEDAKVSTAAMNLPGPSPPEAVVECNFWQLRGSSGGAGVSGHGHTQLGAAAEDRGQEVARSFALSAPWAPTAKPLLSLSALPPRPRRRLEDDDIFAELGGTDEDDEDLPPWPHEM